MSTSPLTAHLGYWLRFVSNHVSHAFARKVEARGVTVAEWVVMRELFDRGEDLPARIAERLNVTRGAVTKLADRLLDKGLITRRAHPDDARAQILSLTDQGRALVPDLAELADQNDAEFFGDLSPPEREQLRALLTGIVERRGLRDVPLS